MRATVAYITFVVGLWVGVVCNKTSLEQRFSAFALGRTDTALHLVGNRLYPKMVVTARRYDVDVSFMKDPIRTRINHVADSDIFTKPPKYYDIIVFGDSSLVWSFSPQLVAQASGLRVAFIGCESAYANRGMIRFAERIAHTYLKDGGVIAFAFADWTWSQNPDGDQVVDELQELIDSAKKNDLRRPIELALDSILRLPRLPVYEDLVEPRIRPQFYAASRGQRYGRGCSFFSWGGGTNAFLLYCDKNNRDLDPQVEPKQAQTRNLGPTIVSDCAGIAPAGAAAENLRAFADAAIPHKAVVIPFSEEPSTRLVCTARRVGGFSIIDLPAVAFEKYDVASLEFEMATHLANTSPIIASAILGRELGSLVEGARREGGNRNSK